MVVKNLEKYVKELISASSTRKNQEQSNGRGKSSNEDPENIILNCMKLLANHVTLLGDSMKKFLQRLWSVIERCIDVDISGDLINNAGYWVNTGCGACFISKKEKIKPSSDSRWNSKRRETVAFRILSWQSAVSGGCDLQKSALAFQEAASSFNSNTASSRLKRSPRPTRRRPYQSQAGVSHPVDR
mmetsp:Transcript_4571/g.11155  ORF Transcript_4571/g.11155 Transcript_4571/m.11155 type:complete len:186 (+) Transcript_4571:833-1390(+)